MTDRVQVVVAANSSRQERPFLEPLWQTTFGAGLKIRF